MKKSRFSMVVPLDKSSGKSFMKLVIENQEVNIENYGYNSLHAYAVVFHDLRFYHELLVNDLV